MMTETTLGSLFDPEPSRWGLRGDPYLWTKMRAYFATTPLPPDEAGLDELIGQAFRALSGQSLSQTEPFTVMEFAEGGMSSGMISSDFWRDTALPLLRSRYAEA